MKNHRIKTAVVSLAAFVTSSGLFAANEPVIVQAEVGTLGADWATLVQGSDTVVSSNSDGAGANPATAARVISFSVVFPAAGTYDLYARVNVGAGNADDDSFFYGNGFGAKTVTADDDWTTVNGLGTGGYTISGDTVTGGGVAGTEVWKWINLSGFTGQGETGIQFTVPGGALTQTFQIGAREDGLAIDQFAFGVSGVNYTVNNLDTGTGGTGSDPQGPFTPTGPPIATGKHKFLGSVHSPSQILNFDKYFNQVTPENSGKWGSVEGTRDVMNWAQLDAAYALAKDNGFPFRFHVLIWGNQQPTWIESLPPAEQLEEIEEWFAAVAARYPDIDYIEVVNEPTNDPPDGPGDGNYINALGGSGTTGWDWVINAFTLARLHFPDTKLMINEYGIVSGGARLNQYLGLIQLLQERGLVDLIGVQGHAFSTTVSGATLQASLDTLAASTGLHLMVTEMDVDSLNDATQLANYQKIFTVFWNHPSLVGVTLWGYRPGLWRNDQGAYIALDNGAERPSLVWLQDFVDGINPGITPAFYTQPDDVVAAADVNVAFEVDAQGSPAPTIQWQRSIDDGASWTDLANDATFSGVDTPTLAVAATNVSMSGDQFRAVATNGVGSAVMSAPADLDVIDLQVSLPPPISTTAGQSTTLTAAIGGGTTPTGYQWQFQPGGTGAWSDIVGATGATHQIPSTQRFSEGNYRVVVSANGIDATSGSTSITVTTPPSSNSRYLSLSTRGVAELGDDVLIPGFTIAGPGTKRMLIRAAGATLGVTPFNIQGVLPDPRITLNQWNTGTSSFVNINSNDNWGDNANAAEISQVSSDLFAFPLTDANDSALLVDLPQGQYTVVTDGVSNSTGIAIVELWDADTGTPTAVLTSISTRGLSGPGNEVIIPGFVISNEGPKTVLIRVVGPTLAGAPFNVTGAMVDPNLTVYLHHPITGVGTVIYQQDDWGDNPDSAYTTQISQQVFAFTINAGSADAAVVMTLPPGVYSVHGGSADGVSTGVVIVEVYHVQ